MADEGFLSTVTGIFEDIIYSPLNLVLVAVCLYVIYRFILKREDEPKPTITPGLPKIKPRDFTVEQLLPYDGKGEDGRILIAVNGKVFDVSRGRAFYGPEGPYGAFAGHDATRGLATFSLNEESIRHEYDDCSDLTNMQMESVREWEMQFTEKYDYVGKLLKPGEVATEYSEAEITDGETDGEKVKTS